MPVERKTEHLLVHAVRVQISHADGLGTLTFDGPPSGSMILGSHVYVSEVWDQANAAIDVGRVDDPNAYIPTATFLPAAAGWKDSPVYSVIPAGENGRMTVTIAGDAAPTTGHADIIVLYYPHES